MSLTTIPADVPLRRQRRARAARRTFLTAVALAVVLGALGVFGVRSGTVRATGGGYELEVRYPEVARPGLAIPWSVVVRHPGGFDGPVVLSNRSDYFDMFDENAMEPEPDKTTSDGERVVWELSPPESGDTMEVSFDTRMGPNIHWGRDGETTLLIDGKPVISVRYRTWVMP